MIRTVTLNSGFDDTFHVTQIPWGGVSDVTFYSSVPSGKGVNVARTAAAVGAEVCAYAFVGEKDVDDFERRLALSGVIPRLVPVTGETRHNLTLFIEGASEMASHMVGRGFQTTTGNDVDRLAKMLTNEVARGDIVTLSGSLPYGLSLNTWPRLADIVLKAGATLLVDLQGESLLRVLAQGGVYAATPNEQESYALLDNTPRSRSKAIVAAVFRLKKWLVKEPMVTMGAEGVAFLTSEHASAEHVSALKCPVDLPRIAVGAGDAFLAGYAGALDRGESDQAIFWGLATSASHVAAVAVSDIGADSSVRLTKIVRTEYWPVEI